MPTGLALGLISPERQMMYDTKMKMLAKTAKQLKKDQVFPNSDLAKALGLDLRRETTLEECVYDDRKSVRRMWPKPWEGMLTRA